jgi:hypothetical protein
MSVSIPVAFNASLNPAVIGYRVWWGEVSSGIYNAPGSPKDLGNTLSGTIEISGNGSVFIAFSSYTATAEGTVSPEITGKFLTPVGVRRGT